MRKDKSYIKAVKDWENTLDVQAKKSTNLDKEA